MSIEEGACMYAYLNYLRQYLPGRAMLTTGLVTHQTATYGLSRKSLKNSRLPRSLRDALDLAAINWLSWYKNAVCGEQLSLYSLEYEFFGVRAISRSTS